jgi:K+:H+ antiporter
MDSEITLVIGDVTLVLAVSSLFGALARACRQPAVTGQILAGILLGPSLLGRLPGHLTARLFPPAVLGPLTVLAQIAVVVFMFVVGYELDLRPLRQHRRAVPLVAAATLIVPLCLGSGAALLLRPAFAALGPVATGRSFVLFTGVAVAITALPVLAAIVRERGIAGSTVGVTATAAAGIMDVAAWLVLAVALVGTAHHAARPWPVTLLLLCCFVAVMPLAVRPALRWWASRPGALRSHQLVVALTLALGSAWVTSSLGLHPVFGGFLAGLVMRGADGIPDPAVLQPAEQVAGLFLPLFFTVTGLSLNIGALDGRAWLLLGLVCLVAAAGKLGPGYLAARAGGLSRREGAAVAVLVNTRGLTELIALNVALSAGLIGPRLFTVLVLMALAMTLLTVPLLALIRVPPAAPPAPGGARTAGCRREPVTAPPRRA